MADVTLIVNSEMVTFKLGNSPMDIYGRLVSGKNTATLLVVCPEYIPNSHAMIVIWFDKKCCYAKVKNEFNAQIQTKLEYETGNGKVYLPRDRYGNIYDRDGKCFLRNATEQVSLRNGDEVQVTKGDISLTFNIFFGQEQHASKCDHGDNRKSFSNTVTYFENITQDKTGNKCNARGREGQLVCHSEHGNEYTYKSVQIKGIANTGISCYANGIIQILAQTKHFLGNVQKSDKGMTLAFSLMTVLKEINEPCDQNQVIRKEIVDEMMGIIAEDSSFARYRQNDCLEFLMYIFERLKRESVEHISMFEMKLHNVIESLPCGHIELCDSQTSFHLLVPLCRDRNDRHPSIKSGLKKILNDVERFSGKVLPCRDCYKNKATRNKWSDKVQAISKAPEILILQIGRVDTSKYYNFLTKQNEFVQYDPELTIDEQHWVCNGKKETIQRVYRLYGVVSHIGSVNSGHFFSYVKRSHTSEWFKCDDSLVTPVTEEMVLNSADAFLIFYEQI